MAWWQYLILANLYLVLFYGFYVLLLRRETFFQLNRVYLVASAVLSFMIPAIQADWVQNLFITQQVNHIIYNQPLIIYNYTAPAGDNRITIGQILAVVYITGIVFLTCRLLWQLLQLSKFVKQPQAVAFSFFKKINVNAGLSDADVITAHEEVHAKQWHSADVLIMEAIMILNWFNPVVYFYRRAIKHIHEFIADSRVVSTGVDKAGYAMLLLNHTINAPSHGLVNQFLNHSLLKNRLIMLQKNRSQRIKLLKYGLSAPLFALMIILSSATINDTKAVDAINNTAEKVLDAPAKETVKATISSANNAIKNVISSGIIQGELITDSNPNKQDTIPNDKSEIFTAVEQLPEFPGGMSAFSKFLSENLRYPQEMRERKIEGRVFITFVVENDGSLSGLKVLRDIGHGSGEEAIRTLSLSPKWKPGYQNGRPVRVQYNVPIAFNLGRKAERAANSDTVNKTSANTLTIGVDAHGRLIREQPRNPPNYGIAFAQPTFVFGQTLDIYSQGVSEMDETPQFPGGLAAFSKYLSTNVRYPAIDRNNKVSGKVFVSFIVQEDGSLTNIKALRSPSLSLQNEAIRVLAKSPKWIPGKKDGKPVKVAMNIPVNFSLADETPALAEPKPDVANTTSLGLDEVNIVGFNSGNNNDGQLILLNGEEISQKTMESLDPKAIESMNIYAGEEAIKLYGEKAKNGVMVIVTKTQPGKSANLFFRSGANSLNADPALRPLIIVDGIEKSYNELQKINANTIESVTVLKDTNSIKQYGNKGKNGVLVIVTKRAIKAKKAF